MSNGFDPVALSLKSWIHNHHEMAREPAFLVSKTAGLLPSGIKISNRKVGFSSKMVKGGRKIILSMFENLLLHLPLHLPLEFGMVRNSSSKPFEPNLPFVQKIVSYANSLLILLRCGFSLLKMDRFVQSAVGNFWKYYESHESRPIFKSVEEMLEWAGLNNLTTTSLGQKLADVGLPPLLVQELVTVITRINHGQSLAISGLAGAVSLAGAGGELWSIKGGNWQMASGLVNHSNVEMHLHEEMESISSVRKYYELNSTKGNSYKREVAVVATPLEEVKIRFTPPISIPKRRLQHTHATFVRGLLNPVRGKRQFE